MITKSQLKNFRSDNMGALYVKQILKWQHAFYFLNLSKRFQEFTDWQ